MGGTGEWGSEGTCQVTGACDIPAPPFQATPCLLWPRPGADETVEAEAKGRLGGEDGIPDFEISFRE